MGLGWYLYLHRGQSMLDVDPLACEVWSFRVDIAKYVEALGILRLQEETRETVVL